MLLPFLLEKTKRSRQGMDVDDSANRKEEDLSDEGVWVARFKEDNHMKGLISIGGHRS